MAKSVLYNIYADLVNAMKDIVEAKNVFLQDRPNIKEGSLPMSKFVVIGLPATIRDYVIGNRRTYLTTTGTISVFTQSKKNATLDLEPMGSLVDSVIDLFPISGVYCVASNPNVLMSGSDGDGYQVSIIAFDLRCRWRAFENKT